MSLIAPIPNASVELVEADLNRKPTSRIAYVWYLFLHALNDAHETTDGPKTVTLAKLTALGTNGSITYNAQGIVTASVEPT